MNLIKIVSWKGDVAALRVCVASIRYWYPDIVIELYKDTARGDFDLSDLVSNFGCTEKTLKRKYGSPLSKLELLFGEKREKYLLLDTDCVFVGRVLDDLNQEEDMIVSADSHQSTETPWFAETYYDRSELLKEVDSSFVDPGYTFNSGQMVCTSGILTERDFDSVVDWSAERPKKRHADVFALNDQGLLNYVFPKMAEAGRISLACKKFHLWPITDNLVDHAFSRDNRPTIEAIRMRSPGYPYVVHWAGLIRYDSFDHTLKVLPWGELLEFYERIYFEKTGRLKGYSLNFLRFLRRFPKSVQRRFSRK